MSRIGKLRILRSKYCENQLSQKLEFWWFQGLFFMILGGLGTNFYVDRWAFDTQTYHLVCLVASFWRFGWPRVDPGIFGSTGKDTLRSRLWFPLIFGGFRDSILRVFWVPWTSLCIIGYACFQTSFSNCFGSESGCPWLENWALCKGGIAKVTFAEVRLLMIPGSIFHDSGWPWD